MNTKVHFAKEAAKSAAYTFVLSGLFVTTLAQVNRTRAAFKVVFKK